MISLYRPYLPEKILKYAHEALDSQWLTWHGKYVKICQIKLQEFFGVKHVLLTNNGTTATHLLAKAIKYKHPNVNRLVLPNNVYVAAWNAFLYDNFDWKIDCLDTNLDTWNADYSEIIADKNTAFVCVHNVGNIINVPELKRKFPESVFVEDNCEGLFGVYEGKFSGTESLCSSLSFFANKSITSAGEGGAVMTNDDSLAQYLSRLIYQGVSEQNYIHDVLGYNYRMTNIQAAMLYGQLEYLEEILEKKAKIFDFYRKELVKIPRVKIQIIDPATKPANWIMAVRILNSNGYREKKEFFDKRGIETRPFFYPMTAHKHLSHIAKYGANAELLSKECFMIPSHPELLESETQQIVSAVGEYAT